MSVGSHPHESIVDAIRSRVGGGSHVVVTCRGEAGIGKTTLLDRLARTRGATVLRGRGVPGESGIPYAALQLLTRRQHATIRTLPALERDVLLAAVSLTDPGAVDVDLLAAATYRLLTVLSADAPVLCLVDDAQWIDDGSLAALAGAGRMLHGQPVAVVCAAADSPSVPSLPDSTTYRLRPLDETAADALLRREQPGLADRVRETIVAESSGNPRALNEFAAALPGPVRRGRHPHALRRYRIHTLPAPRRLCEELDTHWDGLDPSTRWALLCAAVDGTGEPSVITDDPRVLDPAVAAGLIRRHGETLRFVHPLSRAAIYQRMPRHHRLNAHRRQAGVLEGGSHTEQRLWHLTAATTGADELLAVALESSTRTSPIRDCAAELAVTWERAANLSATSRQRTRRLLAAATAAVDAGNLAHGTALLDRTDSPTGSVAERATVTRLRAAIEAVSGTSREAAADALFAGGSAPSLIDAARYAWDSTDPALLAGIAERLATADAPAGSDAELLARAVTGVRLLAEGSFPEGQTLVTAAFGELGDPRTSGRGPQALSLLASAAVSVGADECGLACVETALRRWRRQGATGRLPRAMLTRAALLFHSGQVVAAVTTARRARELAAELGQRHVVELIDHWSLLPTAIRGDVDDYDTLIRGPEPADRPGVAPVPTRFTAEVGILLDLARRRYGTALWRCATAPDADITNAVGLAPAYVEAAVGAGDGEAAVAPLARIEAHARYTTQDWIRAVAARCRAFAAPASRAEEHYRRAVELHRNGGRPFEHGRTRLLYGEWLRRRLRHSDAQRELAAAGEIFVRVGARTWAQRARDELSAARKRSAPGGERHPSIANLTPQETQVVGLAAAGYSNREIGARLTLSPRTVGYHLYKSFPKLGVSSRHELSRVLSDLSA